MKKRNMLIVSRPQARELLAKGGFYQVGEASMSALASEMQALLEDRMQLVRAQGSKMKRLTPRMARYLVRAGRV